MNRRGTSSCGRPLIQRAGKLTEDAVRLPALRVGAEPELAAEAREPEVPEVALATEGRHGALVERRRPVDGYAEGCRAARVVTMIPVRGRKI